MSVTIPTLPSSVLTIGSFDGVHLGHQLLLQTLEKNCQEQDIPVILTFSNHPSTLFRKNAPTPLITPLSQRLSLLSSYCPSALVIPLAFTQELANTPYDVFLSKLHHELHFHTLILGKQAVLGKERQGGEEQVTLLGKTIGFKTLYIEKKQLQGSPCSSARIRTLITDGDLSQVATLLNRPYSLVGIVEKDSTSFYCSFPDLCLPPPGNYTVSIDRFLCRGEREGDKIRFEKGEVNQKVEIIF